MRAKALALFSGGLDSMLAARLVMEQGIEVVALQFITPFFGYKNKGREEEAAREFFGKFGVRATIIDISAEYISMIRHPRYGYGKNFNPCVDCKIFMMGKAKALMEELGADFIISGEVLGQRPMSQRRDAMRTVERESGLDGYLLRPLSAKLLKPTTAEERGLIDREMLLDISGRSRKRQMELAERFGISDYPTPAGGCMLTDPILSKRIELLLKGDGDVGVEEVRLLSLGRHFRLPGGMLYVGRNEKDNQGIAALAGPGDHTLRARDFPGPVSLFRGSPSAEDLAAAARITARYCDAKRVGDVAVTVFAGGAEIETMTVAPIDEVGLEALRAIY
jgi:tRNA-specific 2-thiouridylase